MPRCADTNTQNIMSAHTSRGLSTAQALEALHAKLDERGAEAYWQAFSRFLRFELTKEDFDRMALAAVGPNAGLHNAVIMALLNDAQNLNAAGEIDGGHPFALHHIFQSKTGEGDSTQRMEGSASANDGTASAAQPSAPKLMLKISRDGSATAQRPDLVVDPLEEAQVRALRCPCEGNTSSCCTSSFSYHTIPCAYTLAAQRSS